MPGDNNDVFQRLLAIRQAAVYPDMLGARQSPTLSRTETQGAAEDVAGAFMLWARMSLFALDEYALAAVSWALPIIRGQIRGKSKEDVPRISRWCITAELSPSLLCTQPTLVAARGYMTTTLAPVRDWWRPEWDSTAEQALVLWRLCNEQVLMADPTLSHTGEDCIKYRWLVAGAMRRSASWYRP